DSSGRTLSWTFPFNLPVPVSHDATATYAEVLPGVDLQVTATDQGGFSGVLVVKNPGAAANPALASLRLRAGGSGLAIHAPRGSRVGRWAQRCPKVRRRTPLAFRYRGRMLAQNSASPPVTLSDRPPGGNPRPPNPV